MGFLMKDMVAELCGSTRVAQNPFIVSKLDLMSMKLFQYPQDLREADNPYRLRQASDYLDEGKSTSLKVAEARLSDPKQFKKHVIDAFERQKAGKGQASSLRIQAPSMLTLQCNAIELMRIRQELMMCISECKMLETVFLRQAKRCNLTSLKPGYAEGLTFDHGILEPGSLNFVDDGPACMLKIDLAINELDPVLGSNLNFRSADAFKILVTKSGLEEARVILHYQVMQKQALVVATRCNQALMDQTEKAFCEVEFVKKNMAVPNMAINLAQVFSRTSDGIDTASLSKLKGQFTSNLYNNVSLCIQSVATWKGISRSNLGAQYMQFVHDCDKAFGKAEVKLRALRSFKVSLFNEYCNSVLEEVYASSIKYNVLVQCQRLRQLNQYFQFSPTAMNISLDISKQK